MIAGERSRLSGAPYGSISTHSERQHHAIQFARQFLGAGRVHKECLAKMTGQKGEQFPAVARSN
jgi:hypothetical protein